MLISCVCRGVVATAASGSGTANASGVANSSAAKAQLVDQLIEALPKDRASNKIAFDLPTESNATREWPDDIKHDKALPTLPTQVIGAVVACSLPRPLIFVDVHVHVQDATGKFKKGGDWDGYAETRLEPYRFVLKALWRGKGRNVIVSEALSVDKKTQIEAVIKRLVLCRGMLELFVLCRHGGTTAVSSTNERILEIVHSVHCAKAGNESTVSTAAKKLVEIILKQNQRVTTTNANGEQRVQSLAAIAVQNKWIWPTKVMPTEIDNQSECFY